MKSVISVISIFVVALASTKEISTECGSIKNEGSFPWNVGIYLKNEKNNNLELICFGSIITPWKILTAAHCFCDNISGNVRNNTFYIKPGDIKKEISKNEPTVQKILKDKIHINKQFSGLIKKLAANVAMVDLTKSLDYNDKVSSICVDWSNCLINLQGNEKGKSLHWDSSSVKVMDVNYVTNEDCLALASDSLQPSITSDKICSKSKEPGFDGSGLVFQNPADSLWYIRGVVSSYNPEYKDITPYTSTSIHLNWLTRMSLAH